MTTDPFDLAAMQIEWLIIPGAAAFPALEAERTGGRADLAVSQPPRQAFTHGAGTPDSHQYTG